MTTNTCRIAMGRLVKKNKSFYEYTQKRELQSPKTDFSHGSLYATSNLHKNLLSSGEKVLAAKGWFL
jgi:hypothetical protein